MNLSMEELLEIAQPFCGDFGARKQVHVRFGLLAATDGRALIHIERPGVIPEAASAPEIGEAANILNFKPMKVAGTPEAVVGRETIEDIAKAVIPAWKEARVAVLKEQATFDSDWRAAVRHAGCKISFCPHCGGEVVTDDYGDISSVGDWIDENRPDESSMKGALILKVHGIEAPVTLSFRYIGLALDAAGRLGGADSMSIVGERQAITLRGADWFIAVMPLRNDAQKETHDDIVYTIKEVANA